VGVLRLTHSTDAEGHRAEIAVEVPGMARRTAAAHFTFAIEPDDQKLIRWYFELYREGPVDTATQLKARRAERRLRELGGRLFQGVFDASQNTRLLWAAVVPELAGFRVEIVTDVPGATALPWETMTGPGTGQVLALDAGAMVRAHPQTALAPRLPKDEIPVRVLLVISRPGVIDVPYRSVAHHLARLHEADSGSLQLDVLRPPTFAKLIQVLQAARDRGAPYQVLHFDGHGVWGDADNQDWLQAVIPAAGAGAGRWLISPGRPGAHGYLLFENPQLAGNVQLVDGPALGNLLADADVPLLILNACRSALADPLPRSAAEVADPHQQVRAYGSLAQEVMDTGVAGVLAMRYNIYVPTAAGFIAALYARLIHGRSFGTAVTAARQSLAATPPDANGVTVQDWMVPVAYEAAPLHLASTPASSHRADRLPPTGQPSPRPGLGSALPARPDLGFHGRDGTLLALDRAFDTQPIVLLHGQGGIGKTATAAEFARWFTITGGIRGPAIYTSLGQHPSVAALAAQLTSALATYGAAIPPLAWDDLTGEQALQLIGQLLRQVPLLWILDDLEQAPGHLSQTSQGALADRQELITLLRSARDTNAKLLLISRYDQQSWLGDLSARLHLPLLPTEERHQLIQAVAAEHQVQLDGLDATSPALRAIGGNPKIIIELTEKALRAGCTTGAELEKYITKAAATAQQQD
jgi:hypothetical protein